MSINRLRRVARATSVAAVIVAASGVLETTGLPLSAAIEGVAVNFGTVQSEREKLRRKTTGVLTSIANSPAKRSMGPLASWRLEDRRMVTSSSRKNGGRPAA
jgi:hypothetical protein